MWRVMARPRLLACTILLALAVASRASDYPLCSSINVDVKIHTFPQQRGVDEYNLVYASSNNQIIFMKMATGEVYRSDNEGDTWTIITTNQYMPGIESLPGKIVSVVASPESEVTGKTTVYFITRSRGTMWITQDGGLTYSVTNALPTTSIFLWLHPTDPDKALVMTANRDLYLTEDSAKHFRKIATVGGAAVSWGHKNQHPDRIFAVLSNGNLVVTDDYFGHSLGVLEGVTQFTLRNDDDILAVSKNRLVMSDNAGHTWSTVEFPVNGTLSESVQGVIVYDTDEDALMIGALRSNTPRWADLYISHGFSHDFMHSLRFQHVPDLIRYEGIDGIYLANVFDVEDRPRPRAGDDIITKITYNKGGAWHPLKPPKVRLDGSPCDPTKGCSLHLHGYTTEITNGSLSFFYSVPNAKGLMVSSGNVGSEINTAKDNIYQYFSRDAGVTWEEVAKGPFIPEFGDHGGIILMADSDDPTDYVLFHDGAVDHNTKLSKWRGCRFATDGLYKVKNIRIAPKWDSKQFLVLATQVGIEEAHPTVISVDFHSYMPPCMPNQYEMWTPTDDTGHCILGERVYYKRRKVGAVCFNGEEFEHITREESCECDFVDYECAPCYMYDESVGRCVFTCMDAPAEMVPIRPAGACAKPEDKYWENDAGYVLVEGNKCNSSLPGAISKPKSFVPCPATPANGNEVNGAPSASPQPGKLGGLAITFIVIGVLLFIGAAAYAVYSRTNLVRGLFGKRGGAQQDNGPAYSPLSLYNNNGADDDQDDELGGVEDDTDA